MFTASLLIIAKNGIQHECPLIDRWINKIWYIHAMEYHTAIKRNETLIYATTCMNLENIMQSERNQTQKATHCMIQFT